MKQNFNEVNYNGHIHSKVSILGAHNFMWKKIFSLLLIQEEERVTYNW